MGTPRRGLVCKLILLALVIPSALFWTVNAYVPEDIIHNISKGIIISSGTGVFVAYAPGFWLMLREGYISRGLLLSLGILMVSFFGVVHQVYHWYWRLTGESLDLINSRVVAYIVTMIGVGWCLHLFAPGVIEETVPRRAWIILGAWVSIGVALALTVIFFYERSFFYSRIGAIFG